MSRVLGCLLGGAVGDAFGYGVDAGTYFLDVVSNLLHEFDKGVSIAVDLPYPNANAGQSAGSSQTRYDNQR